MLVDKANFPRWKVCGCCLNGRALATLAAVGLGDLVKKENGIDIQGIELGVAGRQARLALPGEKVLSRPAFDATLVRAAIQAGAYFLPNTLARLGEVLPCERTIILKRTLPPSPPGGEGSEDATVHAKIVLAADGLGGRLAGGESSVIQRGSRLGAGVTIDDFPVSYAVPRIFMACGSGGYAGLVRVEDGRLNIAAALDPHHVKEQGGVGKTVVNLLLEAGFPSIPNLAELSWHGTPLLTRRVERPAGERLLMLGDAAGYVEPFTGEGMAWALACARAVAPLAVQDWEPALVERWTALHHDIVRRRQWVIRTLALVLRRPLLARLLVTTLSHMPMLARPVVGYLNSSVT